MRVFFTGATGYIGSAVVDELLKADHQVLGLARSEASAKSLAAKGAEAIHGNLGDLDSLTRGTAFCDGVCHLAFIHDFSDFAGSCRADKLAIETLGAALAGSGTEKPLVVTSGTLTLSSASNQPVTEDQALDMTGPLAIRAQSEVAALGFVEQGVRTSIVRLPPTNHGPGDKHGFIAQMVAKAKEEAESAYIGDGLNVWPATSRRDAAKVYVLALEKAAAGSIFHATAEQGVSTKAIAMSIDKILKVPGVSKTPDGAGKWWGFLAWPLSLNNPTSNAKTRQQLGWGPIQPTLLADIERGVYTSA